MFVSEIGKLNRALFDYSELNKIPDKSGCYVLTTSCGFILYIGQSVNIAKRIEQHLDGGEKSKQTRWGVASWVYYEPCPEVNMNSLESNWINSYRLNNEGDFPYFNKILPPVG